MVSGGSPIFFKTQIAECDASEDQVVVLRIEPDRCEFHSQDAQSPYPSLPHWKRQSESLESSSPHIFVVQGILNF